MTRRVLYPVLLAGAAALIGCHRPDTAPQGSKAATAGPVSLLAAPDRFHSGDGVTIRYRIIGEGEPVVLLHGYTDRIEMWAGTADSIARDYQVIVPDLRGFGQSTRFADPADYGRKMVTDVVALLDRLGIRQAHLVGYSMGGLIAANLALDHADRVLTATLVAGALYPDSATAARILAPHVEALARGEGLGSFFRYVMPTWSAAAVEASLPQINATNDPAALLAVARAIPGLMVDSTRLARARIPAVAVVSIRDGVYELSNALPRHWPGLRLVELVQGDHADIFLQPEVIAEFRRIAATRKTFSAAPPQVPWRNAGRRTSEK